MSSNPPSPPMCHVVLFPFLAQGHTLPLLDVAKALATRNIRTTIVTTPLNAPSIQPKVSGYPHISLSILPFPSIMATGLPQGCENTSQLPSMDLLKHFLEATKFLKKPFELLLKKMSETDNTRPACVISDFFLGWTLDVCRSLGIPRFVFHGMGVLSLTIARCMFQRAPCIMTMPDTQPINFPDMNYVPFPIYKTDLPQLDLFKDPNNPLLRIYAEIGQTDSDSEGILVNSFEEIEGKYVTLLESFYNQGARAWCIGPALMYDQPQHFHQDESYPYIKWLDEHKDTRGVIYISFGTQANLTDKEMDEIAWGLEMADQPFIWVVKSKSWEPDDHWEERVKQKGLVVRGWVEQRCILAHPVVKAFLSHCGWNSVLEGVWNGVPILAWPMGAEQPLNAKFLLELGTGLMIKEGPSAGGLSIDRMDVRNAVKEMMEGENGKQVRAKAREVSVMAKKAVKEGGSSYKKLDELVDFLACNNTNLRRNAI